MRESTAEIEADELAERIGQEEAETDEFEARLAAQIVKAKRAVQAGKTEVLAELVDDHIQGDGGRELIAALCKDAPQMFRSMEPRSAPGCEAIRALLENLLVADAVREVQHTRKQAALL